MKGEAALRKRGGTVPHPETGNSRKTLAPQARKGKRERRLATSLWATVQEGC